MKKFSLRYSKLGSRVFALILIIISSLVTYNVVFNEDVKPKSEQEYKESVIFKSAGLESLLGVKKVLMRGGYSYLIDYFYNTGETSEISSNYTSLSDFESLDEILANFKEDEGRPYLTVKNENGELVFTRYNDKDLSDTAKLSFDIIEKNLKNLYFYNHSKDSNFEALYLIRYDVDLSEEYLYNGQFYFTFYNLFFVAPAFSLILLAYFIVSNYKKIKLYNVYSFIRAVPIEFYFLIPIIFMMVLKNISFPFHFRKYEIINFMNKYVFAFLPFLFSIIYILIAYIVLGLKSFYHYGLSSFILQNSIIFRIIRFIYRMLKKFVLFMIDGLILDSKIATFIFSIFSLIYLFFSFLIFTNGSFGVILAFFLIATYLIIVYLKNDLKKINKVLSEVVKGNLDTKVNTDRVVFKSLAKNVNSISDSVQNALEKELVSERMKTELITNVSHDLKTPLTSIINYSDLINKPNTSMEDKEKYAKIINEKSHRLKILIENLFEMSKVSSNNIEINKIELDLNQILTQMLAEWSDEFEDNNKEVVLKSQKNSTIVFLDGELTSRIFENLFSNINKYASEYSRVYIELTQNLEKTKIVIKNVSKYQLDISPEELKERFTRGDESRNTEGSGLGLAIASSLTEIQGGTFDIEIDGDLFKTIIEF